VFTVPEFLGRRYNYGVRFVLAVSWGSILVGFLAVALFATSLMLEQLLGIDRELAIYGAALFVGIYTIAGGIAADVMTDVIQLVIMYVGAGALLFRTLYEIGGIGELKRRVLEQGPEFQNHLTLFLPHDTATPYPWTGIILGLGIVLSTAYYSGNQAIVARALGARTEWDAKAGLLVAALLKIFIPVLVIIPGIAAVVIAPGLEAGDQAVPTLIKILLPAGLKGLMFAAFIASLMSTTDSYLNSSSALWTQDVFGKIAEWSGRPLSPKQALMLGRGFAAVVLVSAAVIAPSLGEGDRSGTLYTFLQTLMSLVQGPTLAVLLLGILWRRANQWGGFAGITLGVMFTLMMTSDSMAGLFPSENPFLFVAWWSFVFSLIVTAVVSVLTPRDPAEKTRGLVFGDVLSDEEMQTALRERAEGLKE
jgi:SSS family solute:Na+ symporter